MKEEKKEDHHQKIVSKKLNLYYIFVVLSLLLGIVLLINIFLTFNLNKDFKKNTGLLKEKLKPASVELTVIKNSKCSDCFDISAVVSHIKNAQVNVTKERMLEFDSKEGKETINKYKIEKIPTIVLTGEINKFNIQGLEKKENALLLTRLEPPYTNAVTGKIEGRVMLYNLKDTECTKCSDLTNLINQIKGAGVKIYEENNIEINSNEGKDIIKKYNIGFVPTIILSKDASVYDVIKQAWPQIGSKENDGSYVLRLVYPPFINLTTNKLRGLVRITYLTDKNCKECYNVSLHKQILSSPQTFAMSLDQEETYDIDDAEGKALVAKYNITQVPTIILNNEVDAYPSNILLKQFFSSEKDGSYVFRKISLVGAYKDLTTNQVVKAQQQVEEN